MKKKIVTKTCAEVGIFFVVYYHLQYGMALLEFQANWQSQALIQGQKDASKSHFEEHIVPEGGTHSRKGPSSEPHQLEFFDCPQYSSSANRNGMISYD